jgi:hypothetical protein
MLGPTGRGLWFGEEGKSTFVEPFIDPELSPNQLPAFLQKLEATGDQRSFVILSAVIVELYLDSLLDCIMSGYRKLAEKRDFTFSLKLSLLRALGLIPPHIVEVADLIRKVRNEFAHNFDCDHLDRLDAGLRQAMEQRVRNLYGDREPYITSTREMFKALTFFVLAGFSAYKPNFRILKEKLNDGSLNDSLKNECFQRHAATIQSIMGKTPTRVVEKEGWRYRYFENGVVSIAPIDPENAPSSLNIDAERPGQSS